MFFLLLLQFLVKTLSTSVDGFPAVRTTGDGPASRQQLIERLGPSRRDAQLFTVGVTYPSTNHTRRKGAKHSISKHHYHLLTEAFLLWGNSRGINNDGSLSYISQKDNF